MRDWTPGAYGAFMNALSVKVDTVALLCAAKMRPTRQRQALAQLLFQGSHRHVTAEELHREACVAGVKVSLATVYNSLHRLTRAGLLREVAVDSGRRFFDTNVSHHHHLLDERTGELSDVDEGELLITGLPDVSDGMEIKSVDVVVRVGIADGQ